MGEELRDAPANGRRAPRRSSQSAEAKRWWAGSGGLAPQNQRIWSTLYFFSVGWSLRPSCRISAGEEGEKNHARLFISFSSEYLLTAEATEYTAKMTTTTNFQGISPNGKSSSRVLRPPGGESSFSLGAEENTTPQRKNKMASNIFAEPDDPHAHRRNNPPTGAPMGTLCGEPSAPLRRCQQPILFPKNPQPELTTIHNSGAALVWSQTKEIVLLMQSRRTSRTSHSPLNHRRLPTGPRAAEETPPVGNPASSWVESAFFFFFFVQFFSFYFFKDKCPTALFLHISPPCLRPSLVSHSSLPSSPLCPPSTLLFLSFFFY
uniref:Jupiter microtubule associated homolog 1a n=1 Tax=Takifugu rubripes TaxID=31033 RepID=H2TWV3_TAKRU